MATLKVSLVAVDRPIWEGQATRVIARTVEGDIGILPGHEPYLALLADGILRIDVVDDRPRFVAVHEGFFSVDDDVVKILAETAELGIEIDVDRAKRALERAKAEAADDDAQLAALRRAETRIDAAVQHKELMTRLGLGS